MGRMRKWIAKLERQAQGRQTVIPQKDGTVRRYSMSELAQAYVQCFDMGSPGVIEEDTAGGRALLEAMENAAYPQRWYQTYFDAASIGDVPDLSEP